MDYGQVLKRAWEITWRWKVLWVLGFLVSLSQGWPQVSNRTDWIERRGGMSIPPQVEGLLIALACVAVLVGIAFWVLATISRGALIGGVRQVGEEGSTALGQAWRVGVRRFWTLFGISILTALPIIVVWITVVAAFVLPLLADVGISGRGEPRVGALFAILCGVPFCCGAILVSILLSQIQTYADRAAVLEGMGWIDAFRRGWQVLKDNLGHTLVFWLIFFAIGVTLFLVVGGGILVLTLPFWGFFISARPGPEMLIPIVCGGLLTVLVSALIGSIVQTLTSATWTLAYQRMTGLEAPPSEVEAVAG